MRTTVDLPDDLVRVAKARAVERGESLKELLTRAVIHELGLPASGRRPARVTLPLVGRDDEPKVNVTNADIEAVLATEDAEKYGGR